MSRKHFHIWIPGFNADGEPTQTQMPKTYTSRQNADRTRQLMIARNSAGRYAEGKDLPRVQQCLRSDCPDHHIAQEA